MIIETEDDVLAVVANMRKKLDSVPLGQEKVCIEVIDLIILVNLSEGICRQIPNRGK